MNTVEGRNGPAGPCQARRSAVVGTTGSGKTTLSRALAAGLGIPHVELDALFWGPGWKPVGAEVFAERVDSATSQEAWVMDGNYSRVRELVWGRAQALVWLDLPLGVKLSRMARRTARRWSRAERLWEGNRENLMELVPLGDSLLLHLLRTHWRHRREYPASARLPQFSHLVVTRLRSQAEATRWLEDQLAGR